MPVSKGRKKKKYKFRDPSMRASTFQRFIVALIFGAGLLFLGVLPFAYPAIQGIYLTHSKPGAILFVIKENVILLYAIPFFMASITILLSFCETYKSRKFVLRKGWKAYSIILGIFIITLSISISSMDSRYDVLEDGIYDYSTSDKVKKSYSWSEVSYAKVYVTYESRPKGVGGYHLSYSIRFKDGRSIDLARDGQAKDKWQGLSTIDSILEKNNVKIERSDVNLDRLEGNYRENAEKLIYK